MDTFDKWFKQAYPLHREGRDSTLRHQLRAAWDAARRVTYLGPKAPRYVQPDEGWSGSAACVSAADYNRLWEHLVAIRATGLPPAVATIVAAVADIDVRPALRRRNDKVLCQLVDVPVALVRLARAEVDSWPKTKQIRKLKGYNRAKNQSTHR